MPLTHSRPAPKAFPPIIVAGLVLVWVIVGVYLISLLISKTHQTLYDLLARTTALKEGRSRHQQGKPAHSRLNAQQGESQGTNLSSERSSERGKLSRSPSLFVTISPILRFPQLACQGEHPNSAK